MRNLLCEGLTIGLVTVFVFREGLKDYQEVTRVAEGVHIRLTTKVGTGNFFGLIKIGMSGIFYDFGVGNNFVT